MSRRHRILLALATVVALSGACSAPRAPEIVPAPAPAPTPVPAARPGPAADATTLRIRAAEGATNDWPSYGRDYGNRRFSPLTQIDRTNVSRLGPAWTWNSGINATFQATPIVVDGLMIVSLPFNHVVALDARTGQPRWRYEHRRREWPMCCGPANRGVAVGDGKVFIGTVDARLLALDITDGRLLWDVDVAADRTSQGENIESLDAADPLRGARTTGATGVGIAMAPVVFEGKVIVGITGVGYGLHIDSPRADAPMGAVVGIAGRYGRPGFLAAFDTGSGRRVWQFDTIPDKGWEGSMRTTTPDGLRLNRQIERERAELPAHPDAWRYGGGSAWSTPAIDPERGLLYFGTGNPSPQMDDVSRPGDNLYTVSLVALDVRSGRLRWYWQQVPHDVWGYDVASPPVLFRWQGKVNGIERHVDAVGQASKTGWFYVHDRDTGELLLRSAPFVPQHNLFARATPDGVRIFPGVVGGSNWSPVAVDPTRGAVFIAGIHMPIRYTLRQSRGSEGKPALRYAALEPIEEPRWGLLSAIDLASGQLLWQQKTAEPLVGGVLATAAGLVFTGEGNGTFAAYDSDRGNQLWRFEAAAGVNAPPISYQIDGTQYVAVAAGGNQLFGYRQGDAIHVFKLIDR